MMARRAISTPCILLLNKNVQRLKRKRKSNEKKKGSTGIGIVSTSNEAVGAVKMTRYTSALKERILKTNNFHERFFSSNEWL